MRKKDNTIKKVFWLYLFGMAYSFKPLALKYRGYCICLCPQLLSGFDVRESRGGPHNNPASGLQDGVLVFEEGYLNEYIHGSFQVFC